MSEELFNVNITNKSNLSSAWITLPRDKKDLQEMIEEGKPIEVNCHFCDKKYEFTGEEILSMIEE